MHRFGTKTGPEVASRCLWGREQRKGWEDAPWHSCCKGGLDRPRYSQMLCLAAASVWCKLNPTIFPTTSGYISIYGCAVCAVMYVSSQHENFLDHVWIMVNLLGDPLVPILSLMAYIGTRHMNYCVSCRLNDVCLATSSWLPWSIMIICTQICVRGLMMVRIL